jgi:hypothetical protein
LNFKRDSDDLFNKTTQIKTKNRMINYYFCPEQIAQVLFHEFKNISIQRTLDDHKGEHIGCFAQNIGVANALFAEIMGVTIAVEYAQARHWNHLWLECDSKLVTLALKSP